MKAALSSVCFLLISVTLARAGVVENLVGPEMEFQLVFQNPSRMVGASPVTVPVRSNDPANRCFAYQRAKEWLGNQYHGEVKYYTCYKQVGPLALWRDRKCQDSLKASEKKVIGVLIRNSAHLSVCRLGQNPKGEYTVTGSSQWIANTTVIPDCQTVFRRLGCE